VYDLAHKRLQMISILCDVLVTVWDPATWERRAGWNPTSEAVKRLMRSVLRHYVFDLISTEAWSGAGDTEAYRRVWETGEDGQVVGPRNYYSSELEVDQFNTALLAWCTRNLRHLTKQRSPATALDKVLLRLVYKDLISADEQVDPAVSFDVDHIFPVKRLAGRIKVLGDTGWPIGALSNLVLFPFSGNRQRGLKSIPEWIEAGPTEAEKTKRREQADRWLLGVGFVEAAGIPVDEGGEDTLTLEAYSSYLSSRWPVIAGRIRGGLSF
jgi:hypothetical protein